MKVPMPPAGNQPGETMKPAAVSKKKPKIAAKSFGFGKKPMKGMY
jgi:hypothetical protein